MPDFAAPVRSVPLSRRRVALWSAAAVAVAVAGVPVLNAVASVSGSTKVLTNVIPGLSRLNDLGQVADSKPMLIGVSIPGDTAARDAAFKAITTPGSASYGFTYTPASFAAAFGVSAGVSQAVQKSVEGAGLKPVYVAKDGTYVELAGTAAQVETTFRVSVHNYDIKGKTYFASTTGATVPAAVGTVLGLTNLDDMQLADSQDLCSPAGCLGTTAPPALWGNYDQPDTYTEGAALKATDDYGQGEKVAIFGEGDLVQVVKDLRLFEDDTSVGGDTTDLKPKLPHIPVRETLVNDDQSDVSGLGEWDLDSQSSSGMSPDLAQLQFYFGQDLSDTSIAATYSAWVNDAEGAMIGNSSFGGCETLNLATGGATVDDALLQQAVMMGRSMFVSTGDTGSGGCVPILPVNGIGNGVAPIVEYPSSSPYAVAVGGTTDYTAASGSAQAQPVVRGVEDTWIDSGGGSSEFEAQPADQAALGGTLPPFLPCVADSSLNPAVGVTCRSVPDIAAQSGDIATNNYGIESGGAQTAEAGTSLSSPLMAGMWARVRAAHSATGCSTAAAKAAIAPLTVDGDSTKAEIGFAQLAMYDIAESSTGNDDAAFFDIGGLTNSQPGTSVGTGNGAYTPLPRSALDPTGFDFTSGLGAPDITNIVKILDCGVTPVSTAVPDSTTVEIVTGASSCPPNGTATDAAGDESPTDTALDLIAARDTSNSSQITFTETVSGLPEASATQTDVYDAYFTYGGTVYYIEAQAGGAGSTPSYTLYSQGTVNNTTLATLTGSVDNASGTLSVVLPYATFNSTAKPTTALAPGATLTALTINSSTTTGLSTADELSFGGCGFSLAGDVTTPPTTAPPTTAPPSTAPPTTAPPSTAPPTTAPPASTPAPGMTASPSAGAGTAAPVGAQAAAVSPATRFHPLSYRPLNSKTVTNGHDEAVKVLGAGGVPNTDVVDVLLRVTADQATASAPVLVDSDFGAAPAQQATITLKGKTVRNVVLVTPDSSGLLHVELTRGAARIALAVVGYDSRGAGDGFNPTFGGRVSSTVTPTTTSRKALAVTIGGKGGVPSGSLDAALLATRVANVTLPKKVASATLYATVAGTSAKTAIATVYPGATTTALLVARPDRSGKVTFYLSTGSAKIVVDEYGTWASQTYTTAHAATSTLRYGHATAATPEFTGTLGSGTRVVTLRGLPTGASTVILQIGVAAGGQAGEVQLTPTGTRFGDGSVSYLPNLGAGQLVAVAPDALGRVSLRLTKGSRVVSVSLVGFTALT